MSLWNDPELLDLFDQGIPLIDVRAEIEYHDGSIPSSVNLPIMNNDDRALVGTTYKEKGQAEAINLGHELVSGELKENRLRSWEEKLREDPRTRIFCFRGGLRSQITCQWLNERGHSQVPIPGGYKRLRNFFLSWLEEAPWPRMYRLGGCTGSGKTPFLLSLPHHIDIEGLANHRGSAFGGRGSQPAQITFENNLALALLRLRSSPYLIVEDESVTLGRITIPKKFFLTLREAPLVIMNVPLEDRIQNIFRDYVSDGSAENFLTSMERIRKRLSGALYEKIVSGIRDGFSHPPELKHHEEWIGLLLEHYYDPLYLRDLKRNSSHLIFEGAPQEVREFIYKSFVP